LLAFCRTSKRRHNLSNSLLEQAQTACFLSCGLIVGSWLDVFWVAAATKHQLVRTVVVNKLLQLYRVLTWLRIWLRLSKSSALKSELGHLTKTPTSTLENNNDNLESFIYKNRFANEFNSIANLQIIIVSLLASKCTFTLQGWSAQRPSGNYR
jgi:hypothetical protein